MTEQNNQSVQVGKSQIVFRKSNPRYAGMDVQPHDPTPYLDRMDKMAASMVECYINTGSLLLQPVVVTEDDGNYNVEAGFTRAMTFVHKYDELCAELNVPTLTIPVIVFNDITSSESLMENLVRSEQHYMSIAYALNEIVNSGKALGPVAKQLGFTLSKAKDLVRLTTLIPGLQHLCYTVIDEKAAIYLSRLDTIIQGRCLGYIEERGISAVHGDKDAKQLVGWSMDLMPEWVPTEAFTDLEGNEHPPLIEEPWALVENDVFGTIFLLDGMEADQRAKLYWEKMIVDHKLEVIDADQWYEVINYTMKEVPMGTHPNEIAIWARHASYVMFYVKESDIAKTDVQGYGQTRENRISNMAHNKSLKVLAEAKQELVRDLMQKAWNRKDRNDNSLKEQLATDLIWKMGSGERKVLEHITGKEFNPYKPNIEGLDVDELLLQIAFATKFFKASSKDSFLSDNKQNFEKAWAKKEKEVRAEQEEIKEKAQDKIKETSDSVDDVIDFLNAMPAIFCVDSPAENLFKRITEGTPTEKELKYVAKHLRVPYKGTLPLMTLRMRSVVSIMLRKMEIEKERMVSDYEELFQSIQEKVEMGVTYLQELTITEPFVSSEYVQDTVRVVMQKVWDGAGDPDDVPVHQFDAKAIYKASTDTKEAAYEAFRVNMWKFIFDNMKLDFSIMYLKDGKKLCILGK